MENMFKDLTFIGWLVFACLAAYGFGSMIASLFKIIEDFRNGDEPPQSQED